MKRRNRKMHREKKHQESGFCVVTHQRECVERVRLQTGSTSGPIEEVKEVGGG